MKKNLFLKNNWMKMKNIFCVLFFLSFLISCSERKLKLIYYEYDDLIVTRISDYPKDFFYYGKYTEKNLPESYIKSEFSGRDGGMGAYLIFKKDSSVEIIPIYDNFEKIGLESKLNLNDDIENIQFIKWRESINSNFNNVIYLSNSLTLEKETNEKENTKVKTEYSE